MLPVYVPRDCSLEVLGIAMRSPSSHPGARRGSTSCGVRGERRACGLGLCTPLASTDLIWAERQQRKKPDQVRGGVSTMCSCDDLVRQRQRDCSK